MKVGLDCNWSRNNLVLEVNGFKHLQALWVANQKLILLSSHILGDEEQRKQLI